MYDVVMSLGYNCEISWRLHDYLPSNKITAQLFSWLYVNDRQLFLKTLKKPELLLSGGITLLPWGMFRCEATNINVHSKFTKEELRNPNNIEDAITEMKERYSYLAEKFKDLCKSAKRTLFVMKIHATDINSDKEYIRSVINTLNDIYASKNYMLLVVMSREEIDKLGDCMLAVSEQHCILRLVNNFSRDEDTLHGGDPNGWFKIFSDLGLQKK